MSPANCGSRRPEDLYDAICDEGNLTRRQLFIWVAQHLVPEVPVFTEAAVFHIHGRVDPTHFARAFQALLDQSDALRIAIEEVDGCPRQSVHARLDSTLAFVDLTPGDTPRAELAAIVEQRSGRSFASGECFVDSALVKLQPEHFVWVLVQHQLVSDAWSFRLLHERVADAYQRTRCADPDPRAAMPQFQEYVSYERERRASARWRDASEYWQRKCAAMSRSRAVYEWDLVRHGTRVRRISRPLGRETTSALRRLASAGGGLSDVRLFCMFATVVSAHVRRTTGAEEMVFGVPFANRPARRFKNTIGSFMNVCPLHVAIDRTDTFTTLLQRIEREVLETARYQDHPVRNPFGAHHYEILLNVHKEAVAAPRFGDLPMEVACVAPSHRLGALALAVRDFDGSGNLTLDLDFNEAVFGKAIQEEIARDLLTTLEAYLENPERQLEHVVRDPAVRLSELSASSAAAERRGQVTGEEWETVVDGFTRQAARTPDAVAVVADGEAVTYGALAARVERIAAALHARGIGDEAIVAVVAARGVELLSAMLGSWAAGAVYLPLEPRTPAARLARVLEQSAPGLVLVDATTEAAVEAVRQAGAARWAVVRIAALTAEGAGAPRARTRPGPAALAYVIYTSGSTGRPKGAMIEHAALRNHVAAKLTLLGLTAGDRVAQTAGSGFDIAVWQWVAALLVGGRVEVVGDAVARDPGRLRAAVAAAGVTVLETVPAMLRLVVADDDGGDAAALGTLRWMVVTGDTLTPALARRWFARYPGIPLVNAYGPTECADDVTHHVLRGAPAPDAVRVPIGRPIADVQTYVVEPGTLVRVAAGAAGELCIGGVAVGRGYLHEPERTAAVFVADPFAARAGARLYRTGDRVCVGSDGTLEFLGRLDDQVKIRGVRIEPGEIEAVLAAHPAVAHAAVVARPGPDDDPQLVAYVAAKDGCSLSVATLREFLEARLPASMMPSAIVLLDALPLTPNGKIDRRAFPEPAAPVVAMSRRPPETPTERVLAEIWRDVLRLDDVSLDDNFFELGGDSISSIRVVARARRHGVSLTPYQVFEYQTIARLARAANAAASADADQDLVIGDVDLTPVQRMLLDAQLPEVDRYNLSLLLESAERLEPLLMETAVEHLLRHHDALRLRFTRDDAGWHQRSAGVDGVVPFSFIDLSSLANDGERRRAIEHVANELQATLNLADGPILRVALLDVGADRPGRLLIIIHHLACDVVSWQIVLEDLWAIYDQIRRGQPIALPPKTASFQRWARRLSEFGRLPMIAEEIDFWRRECAEAGARLPRDYPEGSPAVEHLECVRCALPRADTDTLRRRVSAIGARSMEIVLLTALATAVTQATAGESVLVYLERHGREPLFADVDLSRTVGWFTAVFPVRLSVAPTHDPQDTLVLVDRHLREIPNRGIGYGLLRNATAEVRTLARPELSFNYQGQFDHLTASPWRLADESAGREHGRGGTRPTILDVNAQLAGGALQIDFAYSSTVHRRSTIERFAGTFLDVLRALGAEPRDHGVRQ